MYLWAVVIGGPLLLPLATIFRTDLPQIAADGLSVIGVLALFVAICALEALGTGPARRSAESPE